MDKKKEKLLNQLKLFKLIQKESYQKVGIPPRIYDVDRRIAESKIEVETNKENT